MTNILCIDTSAEICSMILGNENGILLERISRQGRDHAEKTGVFANEILNEAQKKGIASPDAIAICSGPGSYTGLRIGVSLVKGLCYGYGIPLLAATSLQVMAHEVAARSVEKEAILCPMIDARRMEVYLSLWNGAMEELSSPEAKIIDESTFADISERPFYYFGTGAEKCQAFFSKKNFKFIADVAPMAHALLPLALKAFEKKVFHNVAYFEPFYLKAYQATVSKKNVLGN